jgi:TonB family protein
MIDRLQQKCLLGSTILHGLVLVTLLVVALVSKGKERPHQTTVITLIAAPNAPIVDGPSNPGAAAPPKAEAKAETKSDPPPQPRVDPPPAVKPVTPPKVEPVKPKQPQVKAPPVAKTAQLPDSGTFVMKNRKKEKESKFKLDEAESFADTKREMQKEIEKQEREERAREAKRLREEADARRERLDSAFNDFKSTLRSGSGSSGLSSAVGKTGKAGVHISLEGNGTGDTDGPATAGYMEAVYRAYFRAWHPSDSISGRPTVEALIEVASDGRVLSAEISRPSANRSMNDSVQRALDGVPSLPAFPSGSKDLKRKFRIIFDLDTKQSIG